MLQIAIDDHQNRYQGYLPNRFVLHPVVAHELYLSAGTDYFEPVPDGRVKFMGVLIKEDVSAQRPKLISARNEIVYL